MGRAPCCDKNGLKKGPWTPEEDDKLSHYIQMHGPGNWRTLPKNAGTLTISLYTSTTKLNFQSMVRNSYHFSFSSYFHRATKMWEELPSSMD